MSDLIKHKLKKILSITIGSIYVLIGLTLVYSASVCVIFALASQMPLVAKSLAVLFSVIMPLFFFYGAFKLFKKATYQKLSRVFFYTVLPFLLIILDFVLVGLFAYLFP